MSDDSSWEGVYRSLGAGGIRATLTTVAEVTRLPLRPTADQVLARYTVLFRRAFRELDLVLGPKGAEAVVRRALKRAVARRPELRAAQVTQSQVELDRLRRECSQADDLVGAAQELFLATMDVLGSLLGLDLLQALLRRMANGVDVGADA